MEQSARGKALFCMTDRQKNQALTWVLIMIFFMIMFSDVSVIQSVNHPQVPVWIDFSLRAKKIYIYCITVAYKSWTFSVWSCIPPRVSRRLFPTDTWRCFTFLYQPANVNPSLSLQRLRGEELLATVDTEGCLCCPWKDGECVSVSVSPCYLCVCMHAQLSLSLTCHPISPALAPHRYGNGAGVAASKESGETVMQIFY